MTKAELINIISEKSGGLSKAEITYVYDMVWETMSRALDVDGRFQVSNFGTFEVRAVKARKVRNPKTGEMIDKPASRKIAFKPAASLKARYATKS